ncbi:hypothetical protein KR51_00023460 [Rubidibacter lacunae KORDI 51-2]|uniref:Uncharacterized protein n=1 Tax=Rubidibacter lacunae KORDI 51-2 TaxID=582515 RepID=U5DHK0_9CHRO|nr:hypothetical protein KR51_00023460 [Rubidibacter lacunae KORDI 51-2]
MALEWQQKQLLKLLYEEDITSPEKSFAVHLKPNKRGITCFFIEGVQRASDGQDMEVYKIYPAEYVLPLQDSGYLGLRYTGVRNSVYITKGDEDVTNAYKLWITTEGEQLVQRDFNES